MNRIQARISRLLAPIGGRKDQFRNTRGQEDKVGSVIKMNRNEHNKAKQLPLFFILENSILLNICMRVTAQNYL